MPRSIRTVLLLGSVSFAAFLIAVAAVLVPGPAEAAERAVVPQMIITWLLIAIAEASALYLAVVLLRGRRLATHQ